MNSVLQIRARTVANGIGVTLRLDAIGPGDFMRRSLFLITALLLLGGLYGWLLCDGRMPADAAYQFDLARVRPLADALPGDKPLELRDETPAVLACLQIMIVAGDSWTRLPMPLFAYQPGYPDRTLVVDTALDRWLTKPACLAAFFDDAARAQVDRAVTQAALIVLTHEHDDHLGGLVRHPQRAALLPVTQLNAPQAAQRRTLADAALAPGPVAAANLKSERNIDVQRERPRLVTALRGEDWHPVFGPLKMLHGLLAAQPALSILPGHDGAALAVLSAAGIFQHGFKE